MPFEKNIENMELTYSISLPISSYYEFSSRQRIGKYIKTYKRTSYIVYASNVFEGRRSRKR